MLIFTDFMSSCNVINRGVSKDSFHQSCLREICYIASVNEFTIKTQHTCREDNRLADILSRWHLNRNSEALFREQLGEIEGSRIPVDNDLFQFSNPCSEMCLLQLRIDKGSFSETVFHCICTYF